MTAAHVAMPLIGIASGLIGTARGVAASRSFTQPMTCWVSIVGFSGTGKTPGIDATRRALVLVEHNRKGRIADIRRAHETKRERAKALRDAWKKQLNDIASEGVVDLNKYRKETKAEPAMPQEAEDPGPFVAPQLHVSNSTIERLGQILQVQPQGALLLSDELASLFLNMSRYSGGQDNEFWLESWNGGPYTVERMSRPAIVIDHLLIGVVGGMQPDKLARSFKGDADGMSAQFLYCRPPNRRTNRWPMCCRNRAGDCQRHYRRLVDLAGPPGSEEFAAKSIPLSTQAVERFEQFRQLVHAGKHALDGREREWWGKMPAHVLRLTGTLCFLDWAFAGGQEPTAVEERYMKSAMRLVKSYFWPHARACLRQIGLSDRHKEARRILRWIRAHRKSEFSREEVRRDALSRPQRRRDARASAIPRQGGLVARDRPSERTKGANPPVAGK